MMRLRLPIVFVLGSCMCSSAAIGAEEIAKLVRVPANGIQPQVQTDARGRLHLIYFSGDPAHGDIYYVRSDDAGQTFTRPMPVNSQAGSAIAIGTVRGPRIAIGKGDRVHVAWMGSSLAEPKAGGKAIPMLHTGLNDAQDAFEAQRNVIVDHPGLDGGGAVAADAEGNVYVAWHAPEHGTGEANRRVWMVRSKDEGKTFGDEHLASPADSGVCACCGMTLTAVPHGRVLILYRWAGASLADRGMRLLSSCDHGQTFNVASEDPWKIGQCVMSTGHVAPAGNDALAAWETEYQIRFLRVAENGKAIGEIITVPGRGENRKHPAVAANARGEFLIAWTEGTGWNKGGRVAWQAFDAQGKAMDGGSGSVDRMPAWDEPAVFAAPDGSFRIVY